MVVLRGAVLGGAVGLASAVAGVLLAGLLGTFDADAEMEYAWIVAFVVLASPALVLTAAGVVAVGVLVADHARPTCSFRRARRAGSAASAVLGVTAALPGAVGAGVVWGTTAALLGGLAGHAVTFLGLRRVLGGADASGPAGEVGTGLPRPRWQRPTLIVVAGIVAFWWGAVLGGTTLDGIGLERGAVGVGAAVVAVVLAAAAALAARRALP